MPVRILFFGQLTEITGTDYTDFDDITDTDQLIELLNVTFPALTTSTYRIAVDKQLSTGKTIIHPGSTIALLPPFSGG